MGAGRAKSPARDSPARRWPWGSQGSLEAPLSGTGPATTVLHGSVQVERECSKSCSWVPRGGDAPFGRWVHGDRHSLRVVQRQDADQGVFRGARRLPLNGDETAERFADAQDGSMPSASMPGGCNGGAPAGLLAKMVRVFLCSPKMQFGESANSRLVEGLNPRATTE